MTKGQSAGARSKRPNILLICTDQEQSWELRPKALALPGREAIAERGTYVSGFHISGSICSPCRSVLYTGQHWQATGIFDNIGAPEQRPFSPERTPTIGTMLQRLGYRTGYRGKWHLSPIAEDGHPDVLKPYGFETYSDLRDVNGAHDGYVRDPITAREAEEFLAESETDDRPWFLALNYINPHDIMFLRVFDEHTTIGGGKFLRTPPQDPIYADIPQTPPQPNFGPVTLSTKPAGVRAGLDVYNLILGDIPYDHPTAWANFRRYYYGCLRDVDRHIRATLKLLAGSRHAGNTIVVFTTDHGEMLGAHGLRDKGPIAYRELANVPFALVHPDSKGGRSIPALMSQIDVVPTLLALAGEAAGAVAERYPGLKGRDMSGALLGSDDPRAKDGVMLNVGNLQFLDAAYVRERFRRNLLGFHHTTPRKGMADIKRNFSRRGMMRGIHDGRHKLMRWFAPNDHHVPADYDTLIARNDLELYDTKSDPYELDNLAAAPGGAHDLVERLNQKLNRLIAAEIGKDDGRHIVMPETAHA